MRIQELVSGVIILFLGVYLLIKISSALQFSLGALFVGLLIVLGAIWFVTEIKRR